MDTLQSHYARLLGLDDSWRVESVDLQIEDRRVEIRRACLGNPDPVGIKVYAPAGQETFDDIKTTEEAQAGADRREAA